MATRVFVYGSLLRGEPNHRVISAGTFVGAARTTEGFALFDLGAYPGMIATDHGTVAGEIYEVDDATLAALDRLEGHPRYYQRTRISLDEGIEVETYLLPLEYVDGRKRVETGDWRAARREKFR